MIWRVVRKAISNSEERRRLTKEARELRNDSDMRFEEFRSSRQSREGLPEESWAAAAEITIRRGLNINSTCFAAGQQEPEEANGWTSWCAKSKMRKKKEKTAGVRPSSFLELLAPAATAAASCVVEVESVRGGKLRVETEGAGHQRDRATAACVRRPKGMLIIPQMRILSPPIQMCDALSRNVLKLAPGVEIMIAHCIAHGRTQFFEIVLSFPSERRYVLKMLRRVYRDVRIDPERRTIRLMRPLTLDLGAVAKGLAVDAAARELEAFEDFAIDAGGDLYLGGSDERGQPRSVGIRHPRMDHALIARLRVSNQAMCTSGDYERRTPDGEEHHIIDPRTGASPESVISATVVASGAMLADALATAAFVLGPKDGVEFLNRVGVDGLLVTSDLQRYETAGLSYAA